MFKEKGNIHKWLPIQRILDNGIIVNKKNQYIKILKVIPINYNLKSDLEKQSILNSYKIFLKTCNFNFQILIQSNKENLSQSISKIKEVLQEDDYLEEISNNYIQYIQKINSEKNSTSKNFYIIISSLEDKIKSQNSQEIIIADLNEKYFKIKECLSRCGNSVESFNSKKEVVQVIFSFLNSRKYLKNIERGW